MAGDERGSGKEGSRRERDVPTVFELERVREVGKVRVDCKLRKEREIGGLHHQKN